MVVIMSATPKTEDDCDKSPAWLEIVHRQVRSLRFGVVHIVIHDSEVVQIDKTERVRLPKSETRIL
ncbi:MAG TPA: YezD family protein [Verrucomicrobiae bacterium]|jgi:hypothetical protein